jgi:hypothetical protein
MNESIDVTQVSAVSARNTAIFGAAIVGVASGLATFLIVFLPIYVGYSDLCGFAGDVCKHEVSWLLGGATLFSGVFLAVSARRMLRFVRNWANRHQYPDRAARNTFVLCFAVFGGVQSALGVLSGAIAFIAGAV